MSEALERAAALLLGALDEDEARSLARKLLQAFLDPEDEQSVERMAKRICLAENEQRDDQLTALAWTMRRHQFVRQARGALGALRLLAQGEAGIAGPVDDKGGSVG